MLFERRTRICLRSLVRWGVTLVRTNVDLTDFKHWLEAKEYSKSYISATMSYANRFSHLLKNGNLRELDELGSHKKASAIKALSLYSKFQGSYSQFKSSLSEYGIKLERPNGLNAFLRILNATNTDIMKWFNDTIPVLRKNEVLFIKFLQNSGLRTSEAINSFNLTIDLGKTGKLSEYYDSELNVLCHFKYPKLFIRRTKACYITFIKPEFLNEIAASQPVTYSSLRKRIERRKMKLRFNELRDYFGTYLLSHGILEAEINLCQGRIPVDIFIRHYWSPKLKELGDKIIKATEKACII
jgi:intergrase/recombinase